MSDQIINRSSAPVQTGGVTPISDTVTHQAKLHGEKVQVQQSASSLMEDAKEEVSLLFKERMEKTLARRVMSTDKKENHQQILIEKIREMMDQVPDLLKNVKMKALIERMSSDFPATPQQLMRKLEEFTKDPTLQFAALQLLELEARTAGGTDKEAQLEVIRNASAELMETQGEAVRAGLNISVTANDFASKLNTDNQGLRDFYRDAVLDYGGIADTYRAIINQHGEDSFETARKFTMKALSADYNAQGPSIEPQRLKAIMDDMYALKLLGGVHEHCSNIMETMRNVYGQSGCGSGQELMGKALDIKEMDWAQPSHIVSVAQEMNVYGIENQIYLLRELDTVFHEFPEKSYKDPVDRDRLLDVSREALGQMFLREQEE
ncbi:type III secretion system gatekeeper subunit SctW [Hahella sp. CCB-MM4]|uniref:type III secretion system gatekeeper subunit SctW n=1 Tax=Hahella sp. (strain CCB-MM4) TaxID=1926491 RepID=UPI00143D9E00|nr:type III secretion system gatekeeper subunit SctW [Hahella sp. CCB-MM4]